MAVVLIATYNVVFRDKTSPIIKYIKRLLFAAVLTIAAYAGAITAYSEISALCLYGLYFSLTDILLISAYYFLRHYSDVKRNEMPAKLILYGIALADSVSMGINVIKKHVFSCRIYPGDQKHVSYEICDITPFYVSHRFFVIIIVALMLALLFYKMVTSPSIYRKGYLVLMLLFSVEAVLDVISVLMRVPVDLAIVFFAVLGIGIYYFSFVFIPHDLVEQLLSAAVRNMNDGVVCFDAKGKCIYVNALVQNYLNEDKVEAMMESLFRHQKENNVSNLHEYSWKMVRDQKHIDVSYKALYDVRDLYTGCFFVLHDETEEMLRHQKEHYELTHDKLTGLYNKEFFYEQVRKMLDNSGDREYIILCSDIKDFKLVNDVFGVEKGDELLKKIADMLRVLKRRGFRSVFGRMSADRFAVCLPADKFDEKLWVREVHRLGELSENKAYHVYIHLGVYKVEDRSLDVSVMCDRAFMAIKTIKNSYSETISYYDKKLRDSLIYEKNITGEFNNAIRNGQFRMFLQPQINTAGEMIGAEALVRWFHPELGVIPPLEFIGVFEKSGLIGTLDHHIWECACRLLRRWKDEGREGYHISVNISPKDFYFMDIYGIFTGLAEKYEINPVNLKLEITETAIITDVKSHLALVDRLREYGFQVEIDDFGSGYSSLSMLKEINADVVKVDMGFLDRIDNTNMAKSRAILSAIISLSKNLGMDVVTEGVENREQVDFLINEGCDIFQGYYFDKPMDISDFETKYFK